MKRKRSVENKIYVKVVGLKIRLAGEKKFLRLLDIPETLCFGGGGGGICP